MIAADAEIADVLALARPEIRELQPYEHAAWEPNLTRLHANELPWPNCSDRHDPPLNRYPEPQPRELIEALAEYYGVQPSQLLATRGSDEAIDLLTRAFCRAGRDAVIVTPPTFGMYAVAARIQDAAVVTVPRSGAPGFELDAAAVAAALRPEVRIVWLCSPNNPTGGTVSKATLDAILAATAGRALAVIDAAYAEFSASHDDGAWLARHAHCVVLRTLSKAHGLAGARIGALLAHPQIVQLLRRILPPYALAAPSVSAALAALQPTSLMVTRTRIELLRNAREQLARDLAALPAVIEIYPSDANFLLVRCRDAAAVMRATRAHRLLVRDFSAHPGLAGCVRVTVGNDSDNARLLDALREL
ncbi:MAG: histidinol-phosphate transaminase [Steroidobacteraceae bacterium]|nr:histidinol-phosphate transaminase [Steroidobacteraceae bacterium]MDW8258367.1 histidinol-phosphate transaminase [Gammaproteobacteria bacterium]